MELKQNSIQVSQVLAQPGARDILRRWFPEVMNGPWLSMASGWPLSKVLELARGRVPEERIQGALNELKRL